MPYVYHYTSEEGYKGMKKAGKIYPSTNTTTDAIMGTGVYLTELPPTESSAKIISNNWDAGLEINRRYIDQFMDRVTLCLEFNTSELKGLKKLSGNRNVLLYPGTIDLNKVTYTVYKRDDDDDDDEEEGGGTSCVIA